MSPADFAGQIGSSGLGSHARTLHNALQDDDHFELGAGQVGLADLVQWTVNVDHVTNGDRPDEEDPVQAFVEADVHVVLL